MTTRPRSRHLPVRACALAVLALLGTAGAAAAHAESLMEVYRQALQNDPVLKQAEAQNRIGRAGVGQSRAILLPQLNGSVSYQNNHGTQTGSQLVQTPTGPVFQNAFRHTGDRSRSESVGINQVLFDLGDFEQLKASKANSASTAAQLASAQQNLILRVAQAYFTVLTDEQNLKFAEANAKALKKQLNQAQAKFHVGFAAITDVKDAQASYESAVAGVISAKNLVFTDRQALAQITGQPAKALDQLTEKLPLAPPEPNNMNNWVKTALASNPSLAAQRDQVTAAQHDLSAARSERLPTINGSVSYSHGASWGGTGFQAGGLSGSGGRTTGTTVGLVLDVPLFLGGGIHADIKKAIGQRDQARDVLTQDRRTVVSNARNAFNAIKAGISSVKAQKAAVASAKTALDGTEAGYQIGTQTIVNVLIAQEKLFQAQSAYSQARHALVVNRLNLEFAAGTLSVKDLQRVNMLLKK